MIVTNPIGEGSFGRHVAILTTDTNRPDLKRDFDALCQFVKAKTILFDGYRFSIEGLLKVRRVFKESKAKWSGQKWYVKIICALSLLEYDNLKNSKFLSEACKITVFCHELQYWQAMTALCLNEAGHITIGLQHGFCRDTGRIPATINTNPINYLNLVCQTHLVWGPNSQLIVEKYWKGKVISIGKPHVISPKKHISDVPPRHVLLLDSVQQKKKNQALIDTFNDEFERPITIVKHPDDGTEYEGVSQQLTSSSEVLYGDVLVGRNSSIMLQFGFSGSEIWFGKDSDLLELIPKRHIDPVGSKGEFFSVSSSFDWKEFIGSSGSEFGEKIQSYLSGLV